MQIVIDIPKKTFEEIQERSIITCGETFAQKLVKYIRNGTSLPKGHGRLKDIDSFIAKVQIDRQHAAYTRSWTADDVLDALSGSYTSIIIEADGGGEDES